ncbi:Bud-site selection protein [Poronia punctata]|nr:Bud-site selection protein [Poronia punctata]
MPKRKRDREPSLEDKLAQWRKELARALKLVKGFERQRLSKRVREADAEKKVRLEREILVLKSLDLHQTAHAHLCSSLLKIKGIAESPRLPADIKPVPRPELSEEERVALHNVTSALYNRKQVKDVIEEATMGTCIALRVSMPEKKNKNGKKEKEKEKEKEVRSSGNAKKDDDDDSPADDESSPSEDDEEEEFDGPPLLKRKREKDEEDLGTMTGSESEEEENNSSPEFEGFSNSEEEENMFSKYDQFVGGSSSSSSDGSEEEEGGGDDDNLDLADSRSRSIRKLTLDDDISESESESDSDSDDETLAPPPSKKAKKIKAVKPAEFSMGKSAFLPTLMGGYVSGSESASDVDVAPPVRKNRRGQRARQAIWEKKYGEKAKHKQEQDTRNEGWDPKRGAVDSSTTPWKKGIKNPFENNGIHPDRQRQLNNDNDVKGRKQSARPRRDRSESAQAEKSVVPVPVAAAAEAAPKPVAPKKRDDEGSLHPSWVAAKKAKEGVQKVEFQGKKVVFD